MNPYAKQLKTVVFDIETLGLMPTKDMIISASFANPKTGEVFQLFTKDLNSETETINAIFDELEKYDVVITYNGDRFDLPFIYTRANKNNIKRETQFWSIDMYRYLKHYWPQAKKMPHLNQKSVEFALGLSDERTDEIGGDLCIKLYKEYINGTNTKAKDLILLHNADDVSQLAKIYNKANFLPYDQISFEQGFAIKTSRLIKITGIRFDKNYLHINAKTDKGLIPTSIFEDNYQIEYAQNTGKIEIKINLQNKDSLSFVDLNALPVNKEILKDLDGYHFDFLVLVDGQNIKYQEINSLIRAIITSGDLF